ncbi:MAG: di-heme oxidoredictase family protein, partial [Pseudomonadota bacterium]
MLSAAAGSSAAQAAPPVAPRTDAERARIAAVVAPTTDFSAPERFEDRPGGAATSFKRENAQAFSQPSANMDFERRLDFFVGNGIFKKLWVGAPASTDASDGLGPLYNARSCQRCHLRDGRGHPPNGPEDSRVSMLLGLSAPGAGADVGAAWFETAPHPVYGAQLQDFGIPGHAAEGRLDLAYEEVVVALSGGETARLRKPVYRVSNLGYGPLGAETLLSPRIAPQMIGLGLLEAISEADILAQADPEDADGDGVSGRARMVDSVALGRRAVGRFGLKAATATVIDQSAAAFSGDMGLSTPFVPGGHGECTEAQTACRAAPTGESAKHGGREVGREALDLVAFYSRNLAVPARRDVDDPTVLRGKRVFYESGCAACHTPKFVTERYEAVDGPAARQELSFQLIWPYTDLLLHDMGEGLADGRPEGAELESGATGREWRTPPLWG